MSDRSIPKRPLGKTGVKVTIVGYGTAPLGKIEKTVLPENQAVSLLNYAIDRGITYVDTSPDYGSQPRIGEVMRSRRDEVFLATKVNKRLAKEVTGELQNSLRELQTDHVDLVQVHAVNTMADLEAALAPDGALTALQEARRNGLTRFIGITGHARPSVLAFALERFHFDTVLSALGVVDRLVSGPEDVLLPVAQRKNTGVIAMKVFGHGELKYNELALRYSLGLPGVSTAILGMKERGEIDQNVSVAQDLKPLNDSEMQTLLQAAQDLVKANSQASEDNPLFWLYDAKTTAWKEASEPFTVAY